MDGTTDAWRSIKTYYESSEGITVLGGGRDDGRHPLHICTYFSFPLHFTGAGEWLRLLSISRSWNKLVTAAPSTFIHEIMLVLIFVIGSLFQTSSSICTSASGVGLAYTKKAVLLRSMPLHCPILKVQCLSVEVWACLLHQLGAWAETETFGRPRFPCERPGTASFC